MMLSMSHMCQYMYVYSISAFGVVWSFGNTGACDIGASY